MILIEDSNDCEPKNRGISAPVEAPESQQSTPVASSKSSTVMGSPTQSASLVRTPTNVNI